VLLENNVRVGNGFMGMFADSQNHGQESSFLMKNNTFVGNRSFFPLSFNWPEANPKGVGHQRWEASGNVFDLTTALLGLSFRQSISSEKAEAVARETLKWRESRNVFGDKATFVELWTAIHGINGWKNGNLPLFRAIQSVADWEQFWGVKDTGSLQGPVRFKGGDIMAKLESDPASITPEDCRLALGSAGKSARDDGRDLGADVDLVGPGPAYERWKRRRSISSGSRTPGS
jgi:hypothetical protein